MDRELRYPLFRSIVPSPTVEGAEKAKPVAAAVLSFVDAATPTLAFVIVTMAPAPPVLKSDRAPIALLVLIATVGAVSLAAISTSIPVLPPVSAEPVDPGSVLPLSTSYQT